MSHLAELSKAHDALRAHHQAIVIVSGPETAGLGQLWGTCQTETEICFLTIVLPLCPESEYLHSTIREKTSAHSIANSHPPGPPSVWPKVSKPVIYLIRFYTEPQFIFEIFLLVG